MHLLIVPAAGASFLPVGAIGGQSRGHAGWRFALAALLAGLVAAAASPSRTLVSYGFDDSNIATGPDTFAVFEKSKGRVHLSTAFRTSGYRSVEIRDVADDGAFPELQGYFPVRRSGTLYAHFALLMTDPREQLNIALAGPEWFTLHKDGIALWLQTRGGSLYHYTDSIPKRLLPIRPFAWYLVDVAYDVAAGTYDLAVREEGQKEPAVAVTRQPNAASQPGSAVDKFSFIGDNGHDTSNVDYFVDDILLTVDEPIDLAPFIAPGRRKLFFDTWNDSQRILRSTPVCLPAIDLLDFGLTADQIRDMKSGGFLPLLQAMVERPATAAAAAASPAGAAGAAARPEGAASDAVAEFWRTLQAMRLYSEGCAALARRDPEAALARFESALEKAPEGRIYGLSAVLALVALKRLPEADARLAGLSGEWRDDPRWPLALAMIGLARDDLEAAEQPLRRPAGRVPGDPRGECALVSHARRLDPETVAMIKERFPDDWATCLDAALLPEEYYFVLLFRKAHAEAERYATRMAERLKGFGLPNAPWIERIGDAAFLGKDYPAALRSYEEARGDDDGARGDGLLLKLSDVQFLLGDLEKERACREAIYGSLHDESGHPESVEPGPEKDEGSEEYEGSEDEDYVENDGDD